MVIQGRLFVEWLVVHTEVETHVKEQVVGLWVILQLSGGKTVYQPVQSVVLSYPVVDKLGVFCWDKSVAQRLTCRIVFEHPDLKTCKAVCGACTYRTKSSRCMVN